MLYKIITAEKRSLIYELFNILFILRKSAVFKMGINLICKPDSAQRRKHIAGAAAYGRRFAPQINIMIAGKPAAAVVDLSRFCAVFQDLKHHFKERLNTVGQSCAGRAPVIHLRIYIHGVIAAPRRTDAFVPDSLKVYRLTARTA